MNERPTATLVASCFHSRITYRSASKLRALVGDRTGCAAWSEFEASITSRPSYIADTFFPGIAFWPGNAQVAAEFKITGDIGSVRNSAASIAKEFELTTVRVNFEAAAEADLFALDLWLSDWRLEYLLPAGTPEARAEAVWWLTKGTNVEMPGGRVVGNRLIIDGGLGFVARAHRLISERYGRPLSAMSVLVERWGSDGVQRGFFREQRIERAADNELGRILRA